MYFSRSKYKLFKIAAVVSPMLILILLLIVPFYRPLNVIAATFVDSTQANFNTGTYTTNTQYNVATAGVRLTTTSTGTGTYTSAVKNATVNSQWQTIGWVPYAPYGRELPNNGVSETIFTASNANMSNIKTLLHFNETTGSTFSDTSGNGVNFTCPGACAVPSLGKFNGSLTFAASSSQYISTTTNLSTILGGTATAAFWIRTTQTGNDTFWQAPGILGIEESGAGNDIFYGVITAAGRIQFQIGDLGAVTSTNPINNGAWHHIAMSRVSTTGVTKIYVDGSLNQTSIIGLGTTITQPFYSIGRIETTAGSPVYYNGFLDELALYNRALSDQEVSDMYLRGVTRILFQARSCPTANCAGVTFAGPTSTTDFYTDLNTADNVLSVKNFGTIANSIYFQYQAILQSDDTNYNPTLKSVTITYITATSTISLAIRKSDDTSDTNICDLGTASLSSLTSCSYRVKVTTNAVNGYVVYVNTQALGLNSGSYEISNAAVGTGGGGGNDISALTVGTERYGVLVNPGSITSGGSIVLANRFNAGSINEINYNVSGTTIMATASATNAPSATDTTNTILVSHRLNISGSTPGNYYKQVITYSVVPRF